MAGSFNLLTGEEEGGVGVSVSTLLSTGAGTEWENADVTLLSSFLIKSNCKQIKLRFTEG